MQVHWETIWTHTTPARKHGKGKGQESLCACRDVVPLATHELGHAHKKARVLSLPLISTAGVVGSLVTTRPLGKRSKRGEKGLRSRSNGWGGDRKSVG